MCDRERCARLASLFLLHINILLAIYVGAALASGARLTWDPSTYIVVRELLPSEYKVAVLLIPIASIVLLVLVHVAVSSARDKPGTWRSTLLYLYAVSMIAMIVGEAIFTLWLTLRVKEWLSSDQAAAVADMLALRHDLRPLLLTLAKWHPLPDKLKQLIDEAEADAPRNVYVMETAAIILVLLQISAAVLSILAVKTSVTDDQSNFYKQDISINSLQSEGSSESAPLKTKYKNGRLVIV